MCCNGCRLAHDKNERTKTTIDALMHLLTETTSNVDDEAQFTATHAVIGDRFVFLSDFLHIVMRTPVDISRQQL